MKGAHSRATLTYCLHLLVTWFCAPNFFSCHFIRCFQLCLSVEKHFILFHQNVRNFGMSPPVWFVSLHNIVNCIDVISTFKSLLCKIWVPTETSKKQKISMMESQNIAISKFGNLSIIDIEVIDDFEPLFGKEFNIECII